MKRSTREALHFIVILLAVAVPILIAVAVVLWS